MAGVVNKYLDNILYIMQSTIGLETLPNFFLKEKKEKRKALHEKLRKFTSL